MALLIRNMASQIPTNTDLAALAVLLIFTLLLIILTARAKQDSRRFTLRPIAAYARLQQLVSQATESGQPIHVALGSGQLGSEATPEATMALTVFEYVARHASASDQPALGTTGDATVLAAAQGIAQTARREAGFPESYSSRDVSFYGPYPLAYAAGAQDAAERAEPLANVLVGAFGNEGLWLAESLAGGNMPQLGGTSDPTALATMQAALDNVVIGEEVYAAGAYLHRPSHLGSLAAQDVVRVVVILAIVAGVVLASLGYV